MTDHDTPLERAVELFVYAPIGLAMFAKDTVPTFMKMFVARGQTEFTQRRKTAETQADQYKTIGKMAVKYGGPEVKRQAEAAATTVKKKAGETVAGIAAATAAPAPSRQVAPSRPVRVTPQAAAPVASATTTVTAVPTAGDLAIPGYDTLSASQIIDRLPGLTPEDLAAVAAYETAHRSRTTILGKIAQLAP